MTRTELAEHVFRRLTEVAVKMREGGAMTDRQTATAFLAVGVTLAQHQCGPVGAAEWLRDVADEIEHDASLVN